MTEWFKIITSTELIRVRTDEIVYICAAGNYSEMYLTNGRSRTLTFQLHCFEEQFKRLQNNTFVPDMIGDYKIVYTAKDYFGVEAREECLVHVSAIERAVFLTELFCLFVTDGVDKVVCEFFASSI